MMVLGFVLVFGGCLASNSQVSAPISGPGNVLSTPGAGAEAPASDAAVDVPAAEPKPLPGGIASPTVDLEDDDGQILATYSVRGTYTTLCASPDHSKIRIEGELVLKWKNGEETCLPLSRKLVSVVRVGEESYWANHPMDDHCKFSTVVDVPVAGPRKFYHVKCDGFLCRPEEGDVPLQADFPGIWVKTPPPCILLPE